ncbi:PREDICTED: 1-phosphatidylinositol 3-phosphate 5-kinase [Ceratosolen solmsi marchali]|uniref:1-phosphatidylinositol-3-phosphate 5-kinase n=1 Tax=Ceratosolen solmsi marchali TaxID=326594 RepID=A0AAJ6YFB6_9HYME|nr:PREDICTED: 1-phosphatidylinositol 3-phosphate 5-kinase [Ceratosolen solmsi marchali]
MNKNMNSPSKLTEFAPLSPEESKPVVVSIFNKIFNLTKISIASKDRTTNSNNDIQNLSEDSESCKQLRSKEKLPSEESTGTRFSVDASEGRSLPNVLKRISNIVALKNNNLKSYKDSQLRSYWMPDSVSKQCYECGERFTTFKRRHHCRVCGQIFCSKCCCDEIPGKIMGCIGDLRVCTYCCKVVLSYLQSSDIGSVLSADLKALQEDLEEKYGNNLPQQKCANEILENEKLARRKLSVGYMEEKYAFGRSSQNYVISQERTFALQNSSSLRMIYEEMFHSNQAINLQTHRIRLNRYYNCFFGNELVNWMITQKKATTRIQATAIGQALFEVGFIESVLLDNVFCDSTTLFKPVRLSQVQCKHVLIESQTSCDAQEPAWVKTIPQHDLNTHSEKESKQLTGISTCISSSCSSFYLDLNIEASTVTLKRPISVDRISSSIDCNDQLMEQKKINYIKESNSEDVLNDTLLVQEIKNREAWHQTTNLKNGYGESNIYNSLLFAYKQHEDSLLRQLLNTEGLQQNWSKVILEIVHQIVDHVSPDLHHDVDDMDIRQYVQIKKSPGGNKNDCEIVSGIVCSKNVAHKGMNAMIANPKILLLHCGLMYQRVEGKLLSLEPVMLQENEYLGHAVARITALGPDIVLAHRSVSRLAQDRLRESGVTLVLNVKLTILERLARCTGANIIDTIDAHISARYKLGTCKKFYLRNFPSNTTGMKTLMYFEGCAKPHLGATILLRGDSQTELRKVKKVTSTMIFAAYSNRLEKSFLVDEFARPPSPKNNSFLDETSQHTSPNKTEVSTSSQKNQKDDVIILEKTFENDESISDDQENFEALLPIYKSTPVKNNNNEDEANIENVSNKKNFNQVSASLIKAINSYDAIKLFKTKSKLNFEESKINNKSNIPKVLTIPQAISNDISSFDISSDCNCTYEFFGKDSSFYSNDDQLENLEVNNRHKLMSDEKRVCGESVSDKSDPLHQYLNEDDEEVFLRASPNGQCLNVADLPLLNKFKKALEGTILSISPYMKFSIPYLETETGRNCVLRSFFPTELYYSTYFSEKIERAKLNNSIGEVSKIDYSAKNVTFKPEHPFIQTKLTMNADSREVQTLISHFRACGSQLLPMDNVSQERKQILHQNKPMDQIIWPDCLDSASHQGLSVLFCSFLHNNNTNNAPAFCVNPWVVNMDLYGRNDIALGRFLERYCLTTEYKCPAQNCRAQIVQHVRRFAHDGGCVHISLYEMSANPFGNIGQESSNQIFMWSKCNKCKKVSPVVPISDDTWSLSFAKYLELRFHGGVYTRHDTENSCQHSLHHDHQQYFSKNNMLAVMRYSKISLWEISLPPPLISVIYDPYMHTHVIEEIKVLTLKGDEVFSNIREKIGNVQDESIMNVMKVQFAKDQQYFKNKIEELQLIATSSSPENNEILSKQLDNDARNFIYRIEDGLVILQRLISDAVFNWNVRFAETNSKKKDERQSRKQSERSYIANNTNGNVSEIIDSDGYITEGIALESQIEGPNPILADYNAVDAITSIQTEKQIAELTVMENSIDNMPKVPIITNPEEIVIIQGSPKIHQKSFSDILASNLEELPDKKKKKKTILSQLLPSTPIINIIPNPLGPLEHHLLPLGSVVPIVVNEAEPSSIIAYALDSHDYKHVLQEQLRSIKGSEFISSPLNRRKLQENRENISPMEIDKVVQAVETIVNVNNTEIDEEKKVAKQLQNYIEVQFTDSTTNFYCRIYFAAQFATLRENILSYGEEGYIRSLSHSIQWAARGGKSGSAFCKTRDDRFVLKEMTRMDVQIFLDFAPNYFAYMDKCQKAKQPTLLGKIVGIYRVSFKNNTTNAALRTSVLVMENLFYNRSITDKFDLKGSVRNRLVNLDDVDHEGELVLLDENLLNMSCDSPLYIRPHAKDVLNKAIEEDTKFLADNCVMDYSLLVGLEPNSDELVLGIIDYLRTFTWDKKIETIVKKSGILGGQGKLPTIVSPVEYRARFIAAMHKYFLPVPDRWTGLSRGVITT